MKLKGRNQFSIFDNNDFKNGIIGYAGIHAWVRNRKFKPMLCERCHKRKAYDLSNKSGNYERDLSDWQYLCRKCHMELDGRLLKINRIGARFMKTKRNRIKRNCKTCGKIFWVVPRQIRRGWGNFCSKHCSVVNQHKIGNLPVGVLT